MIIMFGLTIFVIIFVNHLLERMMTYLTKPFMSTTAVSFEKLTPKPFTRYLLLNLYKWTTSWFLTFLSIFDFSV